MPKPGYQRIKRQWLKLPTKKKRRKPRRRNLSEIRKQVQEMREIQYNCAICTDRFEKGRPRRLDHCHKTGKIREFLCNRCNVGLGQFLDDIGLLKEAAKYLRKHHPLLPPEHDNNNLNYKYFIPLPLDRLINVWEDRQSNEQGNGAEDDQSTNHSGTSR